MTTEGTDYRLRTRSPAWKTFARRVLLIPPVNHLMVKALRPWAGEQWTHRLPVVGPATVIIDERGTIVLQRGDRCQVAKEIHWGQGRLLGEADRLALDLAMHLSKEADLFLDIGAYTGLFALAVARQNPRVICDAYEIVPENYLLMWENTIVNNLVPRVNPRLVGLSAARGLLKVPATLGKGALASSVALDSNSVDGTDIPIAPLDEIYPGFAGKMVVKIDVEGFEWDVLRGGSNLFQRVRPDIICEVLRRAPCIPELKEFLDKLGYRIFHITDAGLQAATEIVPARQYRDWLFTCRSPAELRSLGFRLIGECQ